MKENKKLNKTEWAEKLAQYLHALRMNFQDMGADGDTLKYISKLAGEAVKRVAIVRNKEYAEHMRSATKKVAGKALPVKSAAKAKTAKQK